VAGNAGFFIASLVLFQESLFMLSTATLPGGTSHGVPTALERFTEQSELRSGEVRVDRQRGVIHGVKILGLESRNGRSYRPQTLTRAVALYEGARVNVDHPRGGLQTARGYEERIGTVRNVQARGAGLFGDFHFNPKHRLAEQLLWDAEHAPENVGFSHNVTARTSRAGGRVVVEEITAVQSVDLVADPATTRGLFEQTGPTFWDNTSQSWQPLASSQNDDRGAETTSLVEHQSLLAAYRLLEARHRQLQDELQLLRAGQTQSQRRAEIENRIAQAGLPAALNTEIFREQCFAAEGEEALARLIAARQQDAKLLVGGSRPRSIEQTRDDWLARPAVDAAAFAAALK
jgi:hypothetical protein